MVSRADINVGRRLRMVESQIAARGIRDERLIAVMRDIPRHLFVPAHLEAVAYEDEPLPIGEGQTISQPYIVAEMTQALRLSGTEKVLEVGTGSGYQAAILARLAREVVTIERIGGLAARARDALDALGIRNVNFVEGDGTEGVPSLAPFDRVIVTAASPEIPGPLLDQLSDDGIMVIPVGGRFEQELLRVTKRDGKPSTEFLGGCRFVPLVGRHGFQG